MVQKVEHSFETCGGGIGNGGVCCGKGGDKNCEVGATRVFRASKVLLKREEGKWRKSPIDTIVGRMFNVRTID